jgi:copper resistance protein B
MRSPVALSLLLLLGACAGQAAIAPAGSAPAAVDLGSSSRVPHIAAHAGEGEGYDAVLQPTRSTPLPKAATPPASQGAMDHSQMDHSQMDHSKMDHGGRQ